MEKMKLYESVRAVPETAKKSIQAGRLKGMTDINPMWRIKTLTESFGPCGDGWNTINEKYTVIPVDTTKEVVCIYELDLVYRTESGQWSEPVHGIGGSMLVAQEKNGLHADDEAVKKAKTDALSVAAKALGVGADVYWQSDRTKYGANSEQNGNEKPQGKPPGSSPAHICAGCGCEIGSMSKKDGSIMTPDDVAGGTLERYGRKLCPTCWAEEAARAKASQGTGAWFPQAEGPTTTRGAWRYRPRAPRMII